MSESTPRTPRVRVVKVGGSLLDWQPLGTRLRSWLAAQPAAHNVLLAGGGAFADAIRRADATHGLGDEAAHWLCIDALRVSTRLLATILELPQAVTTDYETLRKQLAQIAPRVAIFDPAEFLREREPRLPGGGLPHDWRVTTDSIAARLAEVLGADELVLLKSCDAPPGQTLGELAATGLVDEFFPSAAGAWGGMARMVDLRCDEATPRQRKC